MAKSNLNDFKRKTTRNVLNDTEFLEKVIDWNTFFRRNIHRFIEMYFGIELHFYQVIMVYLMNLAPLVVIVACRAAAKSFCIAIFACARCVLYPKTRVVIASSTKKQASLIVSEKIKKELIPKSPNLAREIKDIRTGQNETEVTFWNGSSIIVVPASDNARGIRATMLIYEEFRMIEKNIIDTVLSPFLYIRQADYLKKSEYEHLVEEPIEIYISSAYFAAHWMSNLIKMTVKDMYNKSEAIFLAYDYSITLKHGIRTRKQLMREKKKLGTLAFAMEYENEMVGSSENPFYIFDKLDKLQVLKKSFYPRYWFNGKYCNGKKNKFAIPKVAGEVRILSVDIAMVSGDKNDNSVATCIRGLPNGDYYERQVPYVEVFGGENTEIQAKKIKRLFYDFEADYLVLDTQNSGLNVFEDLGKIIYDEERDIEYPAFTCFNDKDVASRVKNKEALPVVFSFKGQLEINQKMHYAMADVVDKGRLKLLSNVVKAGDYLDEQDFYNKASTEEKVDFEVPYMQTDLLINEMVNLKQVIRQGRYLALEEPSTGTKDRYISLAMGNYLVKILEEDLINNDEDEDWGDMPMFVSSFVWKV